MGEAKRKKELTIKDILDQTHDDVQLEKEFNKTVGEKRPELVKKELEQAIEILNDQQEAMLRYRFDLGTFIKLAELEPWNKEWVEKIQETVFVLKSRRVTLAACREQVIEMLSHE